MSCKRSSRTLEIEARLKAGHSLSAIARESNVTRARVQQIKRRMCADYSLVTDTSSTLEPQTTSTPKVVVRSSLPMKSFTISLTPAVHDGLVEACAITNRLFPQDPITINEYTEELIISRVIELGLVRKR